MMCGTCGADLSLVIESNPIELDGVEGIFCLNCVAEELKNHTELLVEADERELVSHVG